MIPLILIFILFVFLIKNFSKAVVFIATFGPFIDGFVLGGMSIYSYLSLLAIILFPYNFRNRYVTTYPFLIPSILIFASFLCTDLANSGGHLPSVFMRSASYVVFPFLMWYLLMVNRELILRYLLRVSLLFALAISIYSVYEYSSKSNPFVDYLSGVGLYPYTYDLQVRYGLKRTYTFFAMHITNGTVSVSLFIVLLYAYLNNMIRNRKIYVLLVLLAINIFATGSRAIILSFIIFLIFFLCQYLKFSTIFKVCFLGMFVYLILGEYVDAVYESFVNTESVSGSNSEMRAGQFELAFYFFNKSFWLGNGIGAIAYVLSNYKEMMGAESLWIPVMIEQGLLGLVSIFSLFLFSFFYTIKQRFIPLIWIPLGFLVLFTMTSVPNCQPTYFLIVMFVLVAIHDLANKKMKYER